MARVACCHWTGRVSGDTLRRVDAIARRRGGSARTCQPPREVPRGWLLVRSRKAAEAVRADLEQAGLWPVPTEPGGVR